MKIIVPMAGVGDRFVKAGYIDPKPLIEVNGKRIIEYIIEMFDIENDEFVFVINQQHSTNQKSDLCKQQTKRIKRGDYSKLSSKLAS